MPSPAPPPSPDDWIVEVRVRPGLKDGRGRAARLALREAGLAVDEVVVVRGFALRLRGGREAAEQAAQRVFADPIADVFEVRATGDAPRPEPGVRRIDVVKRPGVMDPAAAGVVRGLRAAGFDVLAARTFRAYLVRGAADGGRLLQAATRSLGNEAVEEIRLDDPPRPGLAPPPTPPRRGRVEVVLPDDEDALVALSRERGLSLSRLEMRALRDHFRVLGRPPTETEIETVAQTWSEHCKHKTLAGPVRLADRRYDNLLGRTIFHATRALDRDWCVSVFVDNAGVVRFDDERHLTFKVETHNHPSAIEPYGGAGTGLGGVLRDTLGTGLGARPILSTDVFCVGPVDLTRDDLPAGTLPPRRILRGVTAGVRDYGNRMGIPTGAGAVVFDRRYTANPLVFCGSVGLLPKGRVAKGARAGDRIVLVGGRTGRDGIHGATFSSRELHSESETVDSGAVQIGDPITEKKLLDALVEARDAGLFDSVTDCGAGGLSSAVGEMAEGLGASVDLERVPLKYAGLSATEIWISEAQERMVLSVPPEHLDELLARFRAFDVEATAIGTFDDSGRLVLRFEGGVVADLDLEFLHHGLPRVEREAVPPPPPRSRGEPPPAADLAEELLASLSHPDVASKEWIVRQYDHEVRAGTVVKPLMGAAGTAPSDACVVRPVLSSFRGFAVACGICPRVGDVDPYAMGLLAVDEAVRNVVAAGGRADRVALLDNFCAGDTERPEILGEVVLVAEALRDAALELGAPFISGKDSLNNEYRAGDGTHAIPTTILVSALTIVDDVRRALAAAATAAGNALYVVGETGPELGGSLLWERLGRPAAAPPPVDLPLARATFERLSRATRDGLVRSCHDLSDGGLGVAAAEILFGSGLGAEIDLGALPSRAIAGPGADRVLLFSESPSRFLVEVAPDREEAFRRVMEGVPCARVGRLVDRPRLSVRSSRGGEALSLAVARLEEAHRAPLDLDRTPETAR